VIESLVMSARGEFEITDVLNHFLDRGRFFAREYDGHWTDAGTVLSLLRAAELAAEADGQGRLAAPAARPLR
jgi:glucose-1-phosphate thymidylyltransferase